MAKKLNAPSAQGITERFKEGTKNILKGVGYAAGAFFLAYLGWEYFVEPEIVEHLGDTRLAANDVIPELMGPVEGTGPVGGQIINTQADFNSLFPAELTNDNGVFANVA